MAFWNQYLTRKLVFENHPVQGDWCLNQMQSKTRCNICREICPQGVFEGDQPDWDKCDGCGICEAACPVSALQSSAVQAGKILTFLSQERKESVISCEEQEGEGDLRLPCLGALPWEVLGIAALTGNVVLELSGCKDCEKASCLSVLEKNLERVKLFFGETEFSQRIRIHKNEESLPGNGYSRREMFSMLLARSRHTAAGLLPEGETLTKETGVWRQLLLHRLKHFGGEEETGWLLPDFTKSCTACGLCTKLCPGQALHRIKREGETPAWYMALIPWRCFGCSLCVNACPSKGLSPVRKELEKDPAKARLWPVDRAVCIRCGEPAEKESQTGLCSRCQGELGQELILKIGNGETTGKK